MACYLIQAAYTPEGWAAQVKHPQDVRERLSGAVEKLGGHLVGIWYAFGEYDIVAIGEFPSNVNVAAYNILILAGAGPIIKAYKTTPLLTIEEGLEAMQQAAAAGAVYRPPSS